MMKKSYIEFMKTTKNFTNKTLTKTIYVFLLSFSIHAQATLEEIPLDNTAGALQWAFNQLPMITSENFAPPKISQYKMNSSLKETLAVLKNDFGFSLGSENGEEGGRTLYNHVGAQTNSAISDLPAGDQELALEALHAAMKKTFHLLKSSNVQVYADYETYWAPSVNAMALVLIDQESETVTVIMHGDIDG